MKLVTQLGTFLLCIFLVFSIKLDVTAIGTGETGHIGEVSASTGRSPFNLSDVDSQALSSAELAKSNVVYYDSVEEAGTALREGLKARQETIVVGLKTTDGDEKCISDVFSAALVHTGVSTEGDYLRWHYRQPSGRMDGFLEDDVYYLTLTYTVEYYTSAEQEAQVDAEVAKVLEDLDLWDSSDYEKVRGIYDWICKNVVYDYDNLCDSSYYMKHTAYAALINRTAVCQGYASLFYRLCLELGVDCRVDFGYGFTIFGDKEDHVWNLVKVDGQYYCVDATWGADQMKDGEPEYYYLLKGKNGVGKRIDVLDWQYPELDAEQYCVIAEDDYPIPEKSTIIAEGKASDTASWKLSKTGVLTLSGTGAIYIRWNNKIQDWEDYRINIKAVVVEEGITELGENLFSNSYVADVSLPNSLVRIGDGVFGSTNIVSIKLPSNLQYLGKSAISSRNLDSIEVDPNNPYFSSIDGSLFSKDGKTLLIYSGIVNKSDGFSLIQEYSVPNGVETIGTSAFEGNATLRKITLPESVRSVDNRAFSLCPEASINFPDSLTTIGEYAFYNCNAIHSIRLGKNVKSIGTGAFSAMYYLEEITVDPDNPYYNSVDGVLFNEEMTALIRYPVANKATAYDIPYGVVVIGQEAFEMNAWSATLEKIYFPETVTTIKQGAFHEQAVLKTLHLPDSVETIERGAFQGLVGLKQIIIPDSVKAIGISAFNNNKAEIIVIGKGVEVLGDKAFTRIDFAHQNDNAEIKVYFRGAPPKEVTLMTEVASSCILFGYDPDGATPNRVLATVYYPEELKDLWAPNGETEWDPFPDAVISQEGVPKKHKIYPGEPPQHFYEATVTAPTCTEKGYTTFTCAECGDQYQGEYVDALGHDWEDEKALVRKCLVCGFSDDHTHEYSTTVIPSTCVEQGYTIHKCAVCQNEYNDDYTELADHKWKDPEVPVKTCTVCGILDGGYRIDLDSAVLGSATSVCVDGKDYSVAKDEVGAFVLLTETNATNLVAYTYNDPSAADLHTQYPTGMKVWVLSFADGAYNVTYVKEFDNLLQYSGSSIRITGKKGIRMITSVNKDTKKTLVGKGLAGYTLEEYGTALAWARDLEGGKPLALGQTYTKSNFAYKKGVADPVFADTGKLIQYTNVLVGFNDDQCIPDIAMRPYIILKDANGRQITIYGGIVYRSIGYIAYQNRTAFKAGTSSYNYVWGIIHHVYGNKYDADYKG